MRDFSLTARGGRRKGNLASTHHGLRVILGILVATVMALPLTGNPTAAGATESTTTTVIVQKVAGAGNAPEQFVEKLGGSVVYDLSIIDGFAATLDKSQVGALERSYGVAFVTEDAPVRMQGLLGDVLDGVDETVAGVVGDTLDSTTSTLLPSRSRPLVDEPVDERKLTPPATTAPPTTAPPAPDLGTTSVYQEEINADDAHAAGVRGDGVTVALIDTGVSNVPDLADRIVRVKAPNGSSKRCVNLSGENTCNDTYGHGTFIAGLIAGNGANSNGEYAGVAPDAKILSVKISGRDGSSSVGKIIYAIQWVTNHGDQYGVKVMNLSLGTDSKQSYLLDPLNYAVEEAWKSGITVVVSAGNNGAGAKTISKPADDPYVITTGAVDDLNTADVSDDVVPDFSSRGPTPADGITKPDITAPGARVVSVRSPNSAIEQQFPGGGVDGTYRRGSGTSQAAGIVSGSVALLLSAHPDLTPNQVKYALTHSTQPVAPSSDANVVGAGLLDIGAAVANTPVGEANQGLHKATGRGSLRESQGSIRLAVKDGSNLLGVLGGVIPVKQRDDGDPSGLGWYGTTWYGGTWYGGTWYGGTWYGGTWYGGTWYGGTWYGGTWYGGTWYGGTWYGGTWYGGTWYGFWD